MYESNAPRRNILLQGNFCWTYFQSKTLEFDDLASALKLPASDCLVFLQNQKSGLVDGRTKARKTRATLTEASPMRCLHSITFNQLIFNCETVTCFVLVLGKETLPARNEFRIFEETEENQQREETDDGLFMISHGSQLFILLLRRGWDTILVFCPTALLFCTKSVKKKKKKKFQNFIAILFLKKMIKIHYLLLLLVLVFQTLLRTLAEKSLQPNPSQESVDNSNRDSNDHPSGEIQSRQRSVQSFRIE